MPWLHQICIPSPQARRKAACPNPAVYSKYPLYPTFLLFAISVMKKQFAISGLGAALLCLVVQSGHARPPDDYLRVTARFGPNPVLAGQSVTFFWSSTGSTCSVSGVPGLDTWEPSGNYTFTASSNLQAQVMCEDDFRNGGASASLTVNQSNPAPTVNASYSPTSIYTGQSATLSWNSQYASSCSSTGSSSVSGTSGSVSVTPSSNQSTTITCTNANGSTSATASLTVSPPPPAPPSFLYFYAAPSYLYGAGSTWLHWGTTNASNCSLGGANGASFQWVSYTTAFWNTCYGPGGSTTSATWVHVSPTLNAQAADSNTLRKKEVADLSHLGLNLQRAGMEAVENDFDHDGIQDWLVVDAIEREAHIVLGSKKGYTHISKTLKNVGSLREIKQVFVPANKADEIRITTEH